jgi:hypothetical protein
MEMIEHVIPEGHFRINLDLYARVLAAKFEEAASGRPKKKQTTNVKVK